MLGQYEGVVDSEGAELLAVGQEKAEVLPRQGQQLRVSPQSLLALLHEGPYDSD